MYTWAVVPSTPCEWGTEEDTAGQILLKSPKHRLHNRGMHSSLTWLSCMRPKPAHTAGPLPQGNNPVTRLDDGCYVSKPDPAELTTIRGKTLSAAKHCHSPSAPGHLCCLFLLVLLVSRDFLVLRVPQQSQWNPCCPRKTNTVIVTSTRGRVLLQRASDSSDRYFYQTVSICIRCLQLCKSTRSTLAVQISLLGKAQSAEI